MSTTCIVIPIIGGTGQGCQAPGALFFPEVLEVSPLPRMAARGSVDGCASPGRGSGVRTGGPAQLPPVAAVVGFTVGRRSASMPVAGPPATFPGTEARPVGAAANPSPARSRHGPPLARTPPGRSPAGSRSTTTGGTTTPHPTTRAARSVAFSACRRRPAPFTNPADRHADAHHAPERPPCRVRRPAAGPPPARGRPRSAPPRSAQGPPAPRPGTPAQFPAGGRARGPHPARPITRRQPLHHHRGHDHAAPHHPRRPVGCVLGLPAASRSLHQPRRPARRRSPCARAPTLPCPPARRRPAAGPRSPTVRAAAIGPGTPGTPPRHPRSVPGGGQGAWTLSRAPGWTWCAMAIRKSKSEIEN